MNYLREITAFYDWLVTNPLPPDAQALWHALMFINNKCAWAKEFSVANTTLLSMLGISQAELWRARNLLIQKGRISYMKSAGKKVGVYSIIPFVFQYEKQPEKQPEKQNENNLKTLNKQNKTKHILEDLDPSSDINITAGDANGTTNARRARQQKKFSDDAVEVANYLKAWLISQNRYLPQDWHLKNYAKAEKILKVVPKDQLIGAIDWATKDTYWAAQLDSLATVERLLPKFQGQLQKLNNRQQPELPNAAAVLKAMKEW